MSQERGKLDGGQLKPAGDVKSASNPGTWTARASFVVFMFL